MFVDGPQSVQTLDKVRELAKQITELFSALESLKTGSSTVGLRAEHLEPGASVAGVTMPRSEVADARQLRKEIFFFEHLLTLLTKLTTGDTVEPVVEALKSTNFGVDFGVTLDVAGLLSLIIAGVKLTLDKMKKPRDLKEQAEELGYGPDILKQLSEQSEKAMKESIEKIEAEVFQDNVITADTTELRTAIKLRINGVANRMERGFSFEVRTSLPANPTPHQVEKGKLVNSLTTVRFEPIKGPLLLELPEATDEPEEGDQRKPAKTKKKK